MGKNPDTGSGMNIPDHFSESLKPVFGLKILKFFVTDPDPGCGVRNLFNPGSGMMEKFGSGILPIRRLSCDSSIAF
jgi:hypothetical protein